MRHICDMAWLQGSAPSAYVKNVAVHRSHRRRKLAVQLLEASQQAAARDWQARTAFAHVERDNEVSLLHVAALLVCSCKLQPLCCRLPGSCISSVAISLRKGTARTCQQLWPLSVCPVKVRSHALL